MRNYIMIIIVILTLFTITGLIAGIKNNSYYDQIYCHYRYHCHSEWTENKIDELDKQHNFWLFIMVLFQMENLAVVVILLGFWFYSKETCHDCDMEKRYEENLNTPV